MQLAASDPSVIDAEGPFVECLVCNQSIPLLNFSPHKRICSSTSTNNRDPDALFIEIDDDDINEEEYQQQLLPLEAFGIPPVTQVTLVADTSTSREMSVADISSSREMSVADTSNSQEMSVADTLTSREMSLSDDFESCLDKLQEPFENPPTIEDDERHHIIVRRKSLFENVNKQMKRLRTCNKCLKVEFVGEEGIDFGGLTREMFSQYFDECCGRILQGPPDNLSFINSNKHYGDDGGDYKSFGRAVGLSVLHGCGFSLRLGRSTVEAILQIPPSQLSIEELPELELRDRLQALYASEGSNNLEELMRSFEERYDAGFPEYRIGVTVQQFVKAIVSYKLLDNNVKVIDAVISGLSDTGLLTLLQRFPEEALGLLCLSGGEVKACHFKDCLKENWSSDPAEKEKEVDIVFSLKELLEDIENDGPHQTTVPFRLDETDGEQFSIVKGNFVTSVDLQTILRFLTGSTTMTREIRRDKIFVHFEHGCSDGKSLIANTCNKSITFPVTDRYVNQFQETFIDDMVNSPGFTRI